MARQEVFFPTPEALGNAAGENEESLSGDEATPLYVQLQMILRNKIDSHEWQRGQAIPSEAELCEQFNVSRGTVRRAIRLLAESGYLVTRKGSGTFVADGGIRRPASRSPLSFAAILREKGMEFSTKVLELEVLRAPRSVAARLNIVQDSPVMFMRRVRYVAGSPVICQESWSVLSSCPGLEDSDFTSESLFDAIERCSSHAIGSSTVHYSAVPADKDHAQLLDCGIGDALLVLEQDVRLDLGATIEWSLAWLKPGTQVVSESLQDQFAPGRLDVNKLKRRYTVGQSGVAKAGARVAPGSQGDPAYEGFEPDHEGDEELRLRLEKDARTVRENIIRRSRRYEGTPLRIEDALSLADIVSVLFGHAMDTGKRHDIRWDDRDRFILSKAYTSVLIYPAMVDAGIISQEDLDKAFFGPSAVRVSSSRHGVLRDIEGSSPGMGLGYAAGVALALRRRHSKGHVFCLVGASDCSEGAIWESANFAGSMGLSNLCVIVDDNEPHAKGTEMRKLDNNMLQQKFASFGFDTAAVDGHEVLALSEALSVRSDRPWAIIAHTAMGGPITVGADDSQDGRASNGSAGKTDESGRKLSLSDLDELVREMNHDL